MAARKNPPRAPRMAAVRPSTPANRARKPRPWSEAEIEEAFRRFEQQNPEPKGELEHTNPYTLLVAVVLSAQATDAGVNRATRRRWWSCAPVTATRRRW